MLYDHVPIMNDFTINLYGKTIWSMYGENPGKSILTMAGLLSRSSKNENHLLKVKILHYVFIPRIDDNNSLPASPKAADRVHTI